MDRNNPEWRAGYKAYDNLASALENPYDLASDKGLNWHEGWIAAKEDDYAYWHDSVQED